MSGKSLSEKSSYGSAGDMKHMIADIVILFAPGIAGTAAIAFYVLVPSAITIGLILAVTLLGQTWMFNHFRLWWFNEREIREINKSHGLPPDYHITK